MVETTNYPYRFSLTSGWLTLFFCLLIIIIILIALWIASSLSCSSMKCTYNGAFGVNVGIDANPIIKCGTARNTPCIFTEGTLQQCVTECTLLSDICQAFSFNAATSTMKIVDPKGMTFTSANSAIYTVQQT